RTERGVRQRLAVRGDGGAPDRMLGQDDVGDEDLEHARGLADDLGADPVAGQQDDVHELATGAVAASSLRYARASSTSITSPYLASMSNRLASCGPCARSPTHWRGTRIGNPD